MKKRGRPKRDPALTSQLLNWEFRWQIVFAVLREGGPAWDTSLADPKTAGLKWRAPPAGFRTEDERRFWERHYKAHVKEADEEFTEKVVRAEPRDIPAAPELWKLLSDPHTGPAAVRRACDSSYLKRWGPGYAALLQRHAEKLCGAKRNARYPRSNRKSSEDKRAAILARFMAGLSLPKPISPVTAEDLLRKIKHPRSCTCWRCNL